MQTDQWYKPEPGEPYRPVISFPSKVFEIDPLWKSCSTGIFIGLDPPIALHPATAMVPQVTPTDNTHPKQVGAKPSPSPKGLPEPTAKPPVHQVPPARNTEVPNPANNDPSRDNGESNSQPESDPSTFESASNSNDPKDDSSSSSGETKGPSEAAAANPAAEIKSQTQPGSPMAKAIPPAQTATGVESLSSPQEMPPQEANDPRIDPTRLENPNGYNNPSSGGDPASTASPNNPQQAPPIATVGGEPILAVPLQPSTEQNGQSSPNINSDKDPDDPNDNHNDQQDTGMSDSLNYPATSDPSSEDTTPNGPSISTDPMVAAAPMTTTIDGHLIQALSSPSAILVDKETISRGQGSIVVSGTPIALQQNGDLILGTSTVRNLLTSLLPTYNPLLIVGAQSLTANNNPPSQATDPTKAPQVYRIGSVRITAGDPPITYAGAKIQAISDGAVIVGDRTYHASPTPAALKTAEGGRSPIISGLSAQNTSNTPDADETGLSKGSRGANAGSSSSASVVPFQGSATRVRTNWSLLCGVVIMGMIGGFRITPSVRG